MIHIIHHRKPTINCLLLNFGNILAGETENEDEISCIICMDKIEPLDLRKCEQECSANFHQDCLDECLIQSGRCPHCRALQWNHLRNMRTRYFDGELYIHVDQNIDTRESPRYSIESRICLSNLAVFLFAIAVCVIYVWINL